jgi:hypothetical protein
VLYFELEETTASFPKLAEEFSVVLKHLSQDIVSSRNARNDCILP